jgi:hypothetical protein
LNELQAVSANELPNFHNASVELLSLEPFVKEIEDEIERLTERNAAFPNAFMAHRVSKLREEQRSVIGRMLQLEMIMYPPLV